MGDLVQELPGDGQDDAGGSGRQVGAGGYVKVKFQAESPDDPKVSRVMQKLDSKGLPTYVILKSSNP